MRQSAQELASARAGTLNARSTVMDDLGERMVDGFPRRRKEDRAPARQRKGMYILPSLFTTANMAAGYYAILQVMHGSTRRNLAF